MVIIKNKNVEHIEKYTVTFTIYKNGKPIKLSDKKIKDMQAGIQSTLNAGEICNRWLWDETAVVFKRGKKPKKFTPAEALAIKNDTDSIRQKAIKYRASTKTIQDIVKDRY